MRRGEWQLWKTTLIILLSNGFDNNILFSLKLVVWERWLHGRNFILHTRIVELRCVVAADKGSIVNNIYRFWIGVDWNIVCDKVLLWLFLGWIIHLLTFLRFYILLHWKATPRTRFWTWLLSFFGKQDFVRWCSYILQISIFNRISAYFWLEVWTPDRMWWNWVHLRFLAVCR